MPGDIHHLADEEQPWNLAALHRLGGEFGSINPARRHLCFLVAFRTCGRDGPRVRLALQAVQVFVPD